MAIVTRTHVSRTKDKASFILLHDDGGGFKPTTDVKPLVTDATNKLEWAATRVSTKHSTKQFRIKLICTKEALIKKDDLESGTLSITLTDTTSGDQTITPTVDYVTDDPCNPDSFRKKK